MGLDDLHHRLRFVYKARLEGVKEGDLPRPSLTLQANLASTAKEHHDSDRNT